MNDTQTQSTPPSSVGYATDVSGNLTDDDDNNDDFTYDFSTVASSSPRFEPQASAAAPSAGTTSATRSLPKPGCHNSSEAEDPDTSIESFIYTPLPPKSDAPACTTTTATTTTATSPPGSPATGQGDEATHVPLSVVTLSEGEGPIPPTLRPPIAPPAAQRSLGSTSTPTQPYSRWAPISNYVPPAPTYAAPASSISRPPDRPFLPASSFSVSATTTRSIGGSDRLSLHAGLDTRLTDASPLRAPPPHLPSTASSGVMRSTPAPSGLPQEFQPPTSSARPGRTAIQKSKEGWYGPASIPTAPKAPIPFLSLSRSSAPPPSSFTSPLAPAPATSTPLDPSTSTPLAARNSSSSAVPNATCSTTLQSEAMRTTAERANVARLQMAIKVREEEWAAERVGLVNAKERLHGEVEKLRLELEAEQAKRAEAEVKMEKMKDEARPKKEGLDRRSEELEEEIRLRSKEAGVISRKAQAGLESEGGNEEVETLRAKLAETDSMVEEAREVIIKAEADKEARDQARKAALRHVKEVKIILASLEKKFGQKKQEGNLSTKRPEEVEDRYSEVREARETLEAEHEQVVRVFEEERKIHAEEVRSLKDLLEDAEQKRQELQKKLDDKVLRYSSSEMLNLAPDVRSSRDSGLVLELLNELQSAKSSNRNLEATVTEMNSLMQDLLEELRKMEMEKEEWKAQAQASNSVVTSDPAIELDPEVAPTTAPTISLQSASSPSPSLPPHQPTASISPLPAEAVGAAATALAPVLDVCTPSDMSSLPSRVISPTDSPIAKAFSTHSPPTNSAKSSVRASSPGPTGTDSIASTYSESFRKLAGGSGSVSGGWAIPVESQSEAAIGASASGWSNPSPVNPNSRNGTASDVESSSASGSG